MIEAWRIGTDTPAYSAEDMVGSGAKTTGGRWNRVGSPVVYAASTRALACLETMVHLGGGLPLNRYLVRVDIPDEVWDQRITLTSQTAPVGWDALPIGMVSLDCGEQWLRGRASAIMVVPSIVVPEELNILINPLHPDTARIASTKIRKWLYDPRVGNP